MTTPGGATRARWADRLLNQVVIPAYLPNCLDPENRGFQVDLDHQLQRLPRQRVTLEHAARTTTAFAMLHAARPDAGFSRYVEIGVAYLQEFMWDDTHGGMYAVVESDGSPAWNGIKHPHGPVNALATFQLAADVLPANKGPERAEHLLDWLDTYCWRDDVSAYAGTLARNGDLWPTDEPLPTRHGRNPLGASIDHIDTDTQGDMVESLTLTIPHGLGSTERLERLVDLLMELTRPGTMLPAGLEVADEPNRTPHAAGVHNGSIGDFGHQWQLVRRLIDAGTLLGRNDVVHHASSLALTAIEHRPTRMDAYPVELGAGSPPWRRMRGGPWRQEWWVQLEALCSCSLLADHDDTPAEVRQRFDEEAERMRGVIERDFLDSDVGFLRALPLPSPAERIARTVTRRPWPPQPLTHGWKDISHEVSTLQRIAAQA